MRNSLFVRGDVPITKEEVRAVVLSKLDLRPGYRFLDIGSGTGSISIEVALRDESIEVDSIDRDKEAYDLLNVNMEKFNLDNINIILGDAPDDIESIREESYYDGVFIGGTGGSCREIVSMCKRLLKTGGRLVANFIIMDTFNEVYSILEEEGFEEIEVALMEIALLSKLGKGKYFKPNNPVFIVSATNRRDYE